MRATIWRSGRQYGIRVGVLNRDQYFERSRKSIEVEMDGDGRVFELTCGFWRQCPEFRDKGAPVIRDWLTRHGILDWPKGHPPAVELVPLGSVSFRLSP